MEKVDKFSYISSQRLNEEEAYPANYDAYENANSIISIRRSCPHIMIVLQNCSGYKQLVSADIPDW